MDVVDNDFWWTAKFSGIRINNDDNKAYYVDAKIMTDTGTSCTEIPEAFYKQFLAVTLKDIDYYTKTGGYYVYFDDCSVKDSLPIIQWDLGGYWFESLPSDYLMKDDQGCFMCIS